MDQWLPILLTCLAVLEGSLAFLCHYFLVLPNLDVGLVFEELARVCLVEETDDETCDESEEKSKGQGGKGSGDLQTALVEKSPVDVGKRIVSCSESSSNVGVNSVLVRGIDHCTEDPAHNTWNPMQIVDPTSIVDLKFFLKNGCEFMKAYCRDYPSEDSNG